MESFSRKTDIMDEDFWRTKRDEICLDPTVTYLNAGSFSPLPKVVAAELAELRGRLACNPMDFHLRESPVRLQTARRRLAEFVNYPATDLVWMRNATEGINIVARSLAIAPGAEILLTDLEYGAMKFLWTDVAKRAGATVRQIPLLREFEHPAEIVAEVAGAIGPATRILFFSHVTSPTGLVLPAAALCKLARERGIVSIIDGAHAPGMIDADLTAIDADFYAANGHKWMMMPTGSGFLAVRSEWKRTLKPLVVSWGWNYDEALADEDSGWGGSHWQRSFEFQGTTDRTPIMTLPVALDFHDSLIKSAFGERIRSLANYARERMANLGHVAVTPAARELSGAMIAFEVPPVDPQRAREWLWQKGRIELPFTTSNGRVFLRISTAWFNTPAEIDHLVQCVAAMPFSSL